MKVSTETLSKYENGKVVPDNKMVIRMVHIYDMPWLLVQHMELHDEAAQYVFPKIPIRAFDNAVLNMDVALMDFKNYMAKLKHIARDNKVTDSEYEDWLEATDRLMELAGGILSVVHSVKGKD